MNRYRLVQKLRRCSLFFWFTYSSTIENLNIDPLIRDYFKNHSDVKTLQNKDEYVKYINSSVVKNSPISYLEFGVYKGESIAKWAKLNSSPDSKFYGFDTFEGLPEDWTNNMKKGEFSTRGQAPIISDPRVKLIKGLFQQTLRPFLKTFKRTNKLVIHMDADLFSSTLFVLSTLDEILDSGDIIMFDEFSYPTGEFKAFQDYQNSFNRNLNIVARVKPYSWFVEQVAFEF